MAVVAAPRLFVPRPATAAPRLAELLVGVLLLLLLLLLNLTGRGPLEGL